MNFFISSFFISFLSFECETAPQGRSDCFLCKSYLWDIINYILFFPSVGNTTEVQSKSHINSCVREVIPTFCGVAFPGLGMTEGISGKESQLPIPAWTGDGPPAASRIHLG